MMNPLRFAAGLLLTLCSVHFLLAQEAGEADRAAVESLVHAFMKDKSFGPGRAAYTGEMRLFGARATPGATYHDSRYEARIRVNEQDATSAAVAVAIVETKTSQQSDFYLFLRREDDGWKIAAVRTFAPPRGTGQMYAALAAKGKDINATDLRELNLLRVLQFHDRGLKQSFAQRREQFEEIAATVSRKGIEEVIHGSTRSSRIDAELWQQVHDSGLNYVELQESGIVNFNAAAFGETAVGFFYVPEGATPPRATPEDYVLVEPLEGRWYLYRKQ